MKIDVKYVARLARIELTDTEIEEFTKQLSQILAYVDKLNQLDTEKIQPTSHVLPLKNVFREDKVSLSLAPEEPLKAAPDRESDFFKVPKIIE